MLLSKSCYQNVYTMLNHQCRKLEQNRADLELIFSSYQSACVAIDTKQQKELEENKERQNKLKAYIDIASAHTRHLLVSEKPIPFNNGKLSILTVQIESPSRDDMYAAQLYTEATGQMKFVTNEYLRINSEASAQRIIAEQYYKEQKEKLQKESNIINENILKYLHTSEFSEFLERLHSDYQQFCIGIDTKDNNLCNENYISIGTLRVPLPIPIGKEEHIMKLTGGELFDTKTKTVGIPMSIKVVEGQAITVEYTNDLEENLLSGIRNLFLNIARYHKTEFNQICLIDPIRFNNSSLGCLAPLANGKNSFIDSVPLTEEGIRKKVNSIIAQINEDEQHLITSGLYSMRRRLLVFHDFPERYDSTMVNQIQQLCVNAAHYNVTIILTHNKSRKNTGFNDSLTYIKTNALNIEYNNDEFLIKYENEKNLVPFEWYSSPTVLPTDIEKRLVDERPVVNMSNNYEDRIGFSMELRYNKGERRLINIPFGVDSNGNVLTIDFEDSNFATFICGAARSGKSTLLHTLISGIIKNNHPDDVEVWLIDFKMTEFSRYTNHLPPHIRYIILDESPELVYDILDRLTEIMIRRQNIFKGKWLKLSEVPSDKYMPAILVIIDEFSIMSQILSDSVVIGRENYSLKLQNLLAKGAALGMHFIFASQGFTSGTRGLNDFSKKQIQQRIAMKTEYNEIKETLDLRSASDDDKAIMEQLPVHYALLRVPVDERGDHLLLSKVLYISDYKEQERFINCICNNLCPAPKYNVNDKTLYIDKRSMIIDGNNYSAFTNRKEEMDNYIKNHEEVLYEKTVLFLGEPRRMFTIYPVEVKNHFYENIIIIAPNSEVMPATSILKSIYETLTMQKLGMEIWSSHNNPILHILSMETYKEAMSVQKDLCTICKRIHEIKELIISRKYENKYFVLLGFESIILDLSYLQTKSSKIKNEDRSKLNQLASITIEKRKKGQKDLMSMMREARNKNVEGSENANLFESTTRDENVVSAEKQTNAEEDDMSLYDARDDLKFILTQGPRLGYHFIMVFNTVGEVSQSKIDLTLFNHRILFCIPKSDAINLVNSGEAKIVSELENHSFRYNNGLDALSFRPYLHSGLSWDGWNLSSDGVISIIDTEEYLL